jgi:phosphatidylglycerol:prolipoprotein diacylglycerol transferase
MSYRSPLFPLLMLSSLIAGILLTRKSQARLGLSFWQRFGIGVGAFCGGMIGSKVPFALADPRGFTCVQSWIGDGKTIMFGLVGGYIGVEIAKYLLAVKIKTGDSFAVPVAVAIGIGRIGCFVGGCCFGVKTSLPWGIDFGDGILRHPTQIYEALFHFSAAICLFALEQADLFRFQRIKIYLIAYCLFRFVTEFIRPEITLALGLTGYQWVCVILIPSICWLWHRDSTYLHAGDPTSACPPSLEVSETSHSL